MTWQHLYLSAMSHILQATRLARAMVTKYGMSEALGYVAINYEDQGRSVSSETRNLVESEVIVSYSLVSANLEYHHRARL